MGLGKARASHATVVCHRPTIQLWLGMDQNCYKAWCTAGRPDRDNWGPGAAEQACWYSREWMGWCLIGSLTLVASFLVGDVPIPPVDRLQFDTDGTNGDFVARAGGTPEAV